MKRYKTYQGNM